MPTFDVLMPVKNGLPYLRDAIESVRHQTLTDWRMFVLDHGSTDGSLALAHQFSQTDSRIIVVQCPVELTFSGLLNAGLDLCDARYVLRQDADDISLPHRMRVLADAFDADPALVLLGSQGNVIDAAGRITGSFHMPCSPEQIAAVSFFRIPVLHPAAALRLDAAARRGVRYGCDFVQAVPEPFRLNVPGLAEDYFLFGQLALTARCRNVNERLLNFRWHDSNISVKKEVEQIRMAVAISRYLAKTFSLLRDVSEFDPAPLCNHGYRLVDIRDRENFQPEYIAVRDSLHKGLGESAELERELHFRRCLARRNTTKLLGMYAGHIARHGLDRSEWFTVKSWLLHQAKLRYRGAGTSSLVAID